MWVSERLSKRSVGSIGDWWIHQEEEIMDERESLYSECGADMNTSGGI